MLSTQIWIVIKQSTNLELNEQSLGGNECEELTHSQQQPQAPKTHKKSPTIRQAIRTVFCAPKGPFFTDSWSQLRSSARHTLSNQQAQVKQPETWKSRQQVAWFVFCLLK